MPDQNLAIIVLAAGQGTRMKSSLPKILHEIAGVPLIGHVLATAGQLDAAHTLTVVRHERDRVVEVIEDHFPSAIVVEQDEVPGTGRAVEQAVQALPGGFDGDVLVVSGDVPLLDADTLARHYEEHVGKGFYADLVEFMSRGPVVALVLEGPENTWEVVRAMMGATNPRSAAPGTIRGDLGILFTENLVHGSDSLESAARESAIFFPNL